MSPRKFSGAEFPHHIGSDWLEYLESTGNLERYDGICDCCACRKIKAGYFTWKVRKHNQQPVKIEACQVCGGLQHHEQWCPEVTGI